MTASATPELLVQIGLCELALGALLGWAVVARLERPERLARVGIRSPRRLLQMHLDHVMMGLILIAVGLALTDLPDVVTGALIFGTIVNPALFLPLAFSEDAAQHPVDRAVTITSFVATSGGLVAAAAIGLGA